MNRPGLRAFAGFVVALLLLGVVALLAWCITIGLGDELGRHGF